MSCKGCPKESTADRRRRLKALKEIELEEKSRFYKITQTTTSTGSGGCCCTPLVSGCCPGTTMPETLTVTLSGVYPSFLSPSFTCTWDSAASGPTGGQCWLYYGPSGPSPCATPAVLYTTGGIPYCNGGQNCFVSCGGAYPSLSISCSITYYDSSSTGTAHFGCAGGALEENIPFNCSTGFPVTGTISWFNSFAEDCSCTGVIQGQSYTFTVTIS
jgi:hypothetical protein